MKSIYQYITEGSDRIEETEIRDLVIKMHAKDDLYIQVPEAMSESDIQIYLDDTLLKKLPPESSEESLGKNYSEISDCYFEYESIEPSMGYGQKADIAWDDKYDPSYNSTTLQVMHIKKLTYIVSFERFKMENVEDGNTKDVILKLFNGMLDEQKDELPMTLTLTDKDISFNKA